MENPAQAWGLEALKIGGLGLLAVALALALDVVRGVQISESFRTLRLDALGGIGVCSLWFLVKAASARRRLFIAPDEPPALGRLGLVDDAVVKQRLEAYPQNIKQESLSARMLIRLLGVNPYNLPRSLRRVFEKNMNHMFWVALVLVGFVLLAIGGVGGSQVIGGAVAAVLFGAIVWDVQSRVTVARQVAPRTGPAVERTEHHLEVEGSGDPALLPKALEKVFLMVRVGSNPNRKHRHGWSQKGGLVEDTGSIDGTLFLENRPTPVEKEVEGAESPLFPAIWAIWLGALGMLLAAPAFSALYAATWSAGALTLGLVAVSLSSTGKRLAERYHWKSTIAYVRAEGTYGKSEVVSGGSMDDSFESRNIVVRSDFHVELFTTSIITENRSPNGHRDILSMRVDDEVEKLDQALFSKIQEFAEGGVRSRPIQIDEKGLAQQSQANIAMSKLREGDVEVKEALSGGSQGEIEFAIAEDASRQPGDGDARTDAQVERSHGFCPGCGSEIKQGWAHCPGCGEDLQGLP